MPRLADKLTLYRESSFGREIKSIAIIVAVLFLINFAYNPELLATNTIQLPVASE